ncbi:phosphonate ABC transporter ATP-binding protein [bacterium (Candidatus Blackallbacteria) CG17_big_fil_post_rev_8_21_14_2_50_48_46]|uniref:Phosphonate ABC transporter ATP-binding protein n=1 Tax=bacterium (Candidatus Blackallbacteria) CG17_big_fil_post_rev_8_21_14_2_50_48_46 TaxID=2014261 RepID=A0A2M7GA74_9BACT|nr:MAG: phosphonate ABC transporter ATP-binding protein [bacterium (Candidatus Blackallbacteria) CG18_big_fil_WC_8_21_14_2_50_49_26]PIW18994.1 MAG: phosphonate ABC transporter ATP-binding protein [bacterium (Candidatus Blackallbacteria) CG17_big_fil_post_rev_8_21_14_2_50_48_46]PIW44638.1 MAG: phosphonate ABC transporter ATP-binding protein [bacterium (Candidatus Blackallbacteria) CG13_big_fil_rev_8_21_14_2_50_49_14]
MRTPLLELVNLKKSYADGRPILKGLSIQIQAGQFVGLIGLSGAGKSTLLRCINRLVEPSEGEMLVPGAVFLNNNDPTRLDISSLRGKELRAWRRKTGMIFQQFNIVKRLTVLENVLSGRLGYLDAMRTTLRIFNQQEKETALINLERVGLLSHAYKRADALSGGEQQRVAIARTLMQNPSLILADEPVASLDPKLAETVLDILKRVSQEDNITTIVSLHTLEMTRRYSDRVIGLAQGEVAFDDLPANLSDEVVANIYQRFTRQATK